MTNLCGKEDVEAITQETYSDSTTPTQNQIEDWIALISQRIEEETGKTYTEITVTNEYKNGNGTQYIMLDHSPITAITSLVVDGTTLVQNTDYWIADANAGVIECLTTPLQRLDGESTGHRNIVCSYKYGLTPIPAAVRELASVMVSIKALGASRLTDDNAALKSYDDGDVSITYNDGNAVIEALLAQYAELRKQVPKQINLRSGGRE